MFRVSIGLVAALLLPISAYGLSGSPLQFSCDPIIPINSLFDQETCWIDRQPYIPPDGAWNYPVTFIWPNPRPTDNSLRVKVLLSGHNAAPSAHCTGPNHSEPGYVVVKPCAGHYPSHTAHLVNGLEPYGWWGYFLGDSNSYRLGLSLSKATFEYPDAIDRGAGVMIEGSSYGGTGAILQSMLLREADLWFGSLVTIVRADVPHTLFVEEEYTHSDRVAAAWGSSDADNANFELRAAAGVLDQTYYRINGSPADTIVHFDLGIFNYCNTYQIACFGTWHNADHNRTEPGVNLPYNDLFDSPDQDVRFNAILPVFTNSSANHLVAPRGHFNLGLAWNNAGFLDSQTEVRVPIRYEQHTNMGGGIPDQPPTATFDVTLRRVKHFKLWLGRSVAWTLGSQSGVVIVDQDREVTISGLMLNSASTYTDLVLTAN